MNEVYKEFFKEPYPSRATVVVKELMGPTMRVELIAHANLAKA
jgi:enamine deaminase RidA (YjgF/YER057c/UK114 family)